MVVALSETSGQVRTQPYLQVSVTGGRVCFVITALEFTKEQYTMLRNGAHSYLIPHTELTFPVKHRLYHDGAHPIGQQQH